MQRSKMDDYETTSAIDADESSWSTSGSCSPPRQRPNNQIADVERSGTCTGGLCSNHDSGFSSGNIFTAKNCNSQLNRNESPSSRDSGSSCQCTHGPQSSSTSTDSGCTEINVNGFGHHNCTPDNSQSRRNFYQRRQGNNCFGRCSRIPLNYNASRRQDSNWECQINRPHYQQDQQQGYLPDYSMTTKRYCPTTNYEQNNIEQRRRERRDFRRYAPYYDDAIWSRDPTRTPHCTYHSSLIDQTAYSGDWYDQGFYYQYPRFVNDCQSYPYMQLYTYNNSPQERFETTHHSSGNGNPSYSLNNDYEQPQSRCQLRQYHFREQNDMNYDDVHYRSQRQEDIAMIARAMLSRHDKKMMDMEIFQHISANNPHFQRAGWQNRIRQVLTQNKCFTKLFISAKKHYWSIHPACTESFLSGNFCVRHSRREISRFRNPCILRRRHWMH